jgi:protein TonB
MFEDSTFESNGTISTGSRNWMVAAFACNGSILLGLVLIPLIYPDALPHMPDLFRVEAPAQSTAQEPPKQLPTHPAQGGSSTPISVPLAPPRLTNPTVSNDGPGPPPNEQISLVGPDSGPGVPYGIRNPGPGPHVVAATPSVPSHPVRVTGSIEQGLLIRKTVPRYPPIAIASRTEGTVVLQATISKTGTIENLRVISGSPMLQQAAIEAVQSWLYKPYLLGGEPVEVDTTVNVVFSLQRN